MNVSLSRYCAVIVVVVSACAGPSDSPQQVKPQPTEAVKSVSSASDAKVEGRLMKLEKRVAGLEALFQDHLGKEAAPKKGNHISPKWLADGVSKVSEFEVKVTPATRDRFLSTPNMLARSARIVPSLAGEEPNGFRLYAIAKGSAYDLVGLKNGDTVTKINGKSIATLELALNVLKSIRTANQFKFSVLRRGSSLTLAVIVSDR